MSINEAKGQLTGRDGVQDVAYNMLDTLSSIGNLPALGVDVRPNSKMLYTYDLVELPSERVMVEMSAGMLFLSGDVDYFADHEKKRTFINNVVDLISGAKKFKEHDLEIILLKDKAITDSGAAFRLVQNSLVDEVEALSMKTVGGEYVDQNRLSLLRQANEAANNFGPLEISSWFYGFITKPSDHPKWIFNSLLNFNSSQGF